MQDELLKHGQIWGTIGLTKLAALGLEEVNLIASTIALICGAIASISIAWWHIFKRK